LKGEEKLKVHVELGDAKADFEGEINEVFEMTVKFLTQICPNLEILQKTVYTPDIIKLAEKIEGLLEVTSEGPIFSLTLDVPAREAICLALLGAYLGKTLGKLSNDALSTKRIARIVGKARKTISNEMPRLISDGLVERTSEGEYRLTILGIRKTEAFIEEYKKK